MKKPLIIGLGIASFLALSVSAYFFVQGNRVNNLTEKQYTLQGDLVSAKGKLNKVKGTLNGMIGDLNNSFSLVISVQDEMKNASDMVQRTDFMFTNSNGPNPELIIKNLPNGALLNNQRKEINMLLSEWHKKTDILSVGKIDSKENEKIKKDAQKIKKFLEDLSVIAESLTPENSGLQQFQIDAYLSQFPSIDVINTVLASLETAIENFNSNNLKTSSDQTGTGTTNNQTSPGSGSYVPLVTPEEVIAQQEIVTEAENQVATLEEQLAQVEQEIQQSSPAPHTTPLSNPTSVSTPVSDPIPTPTPPPTEATPIISPDSENQNIDSGNTNNSIIPNSRNFTPYKGIIIQPGPPLLIQGTDPY